MSDEVVSLLDFDLAWRRVKRDIQDERGFYTPPFELALVEIDFSPWIDRVREDIRDERYSPSPLVICDVPKGRGAVRPGAHLWLVDQVVYTAAVGACLTSISSLANCRSPSPDFSYRIAGDAKSDKWLGSRFAGWRAYREHSVRMLDSGTRYVVKADVVGCYEHISLRTLESDLRACGAPGSVVTFLIRCLNRWAHLGRGLPQGFSASDILAKLYLTRIDQMLAEAGYRHYRYVDDFLIFCSTRAEAKRAMIELTRLLRHRGLCVQSAKTAIYEATEARREIDPVGPVLQPLASSFIAEIAEMLGVPAEYLSVTEAEELLAQRGDAAPLEMIRSAYRAYFVDAESEFLKSLFHYLLNRLGKAGDDFALEHAMSLLEERPEETRHILRYVAQVVDVRSWDRVLAAFVASPDAVYSYQLHEIVSWRARHDSAPADELIDSVRARMSAADSPAYLRSVCRQFLGKFGTFADLERLEQQYSDAASDMEKSEIICCLHRLELSRRNGFLGVAKRDGEYSRRAVALVMADRV